MDYPPQSHLTPGTEALKSASIQTQGECLPLGVPSPCHPGFVFVCRVLP